MTTKNDDGWDWCMSGYHALTTLNKPWPEYSPAPPNIESMPVVKHSYLDRRHQIAISKWPELPVEALAICKSEAKGFVLFYCDINWHPLASVRLDTMEQAIAEAEAQVVRLGLWNRAGRVKAMSSWVTPHASIFISRATIVECEISVDDQGPDFILNTAYGPNNCHAKKTKWSYNAAGCALQGWMPNALLDYHKAGASLEIWYFALHPETVQLCMPNSIVGERQPIDMLAR